LLSTLFALLCFSLVFGRGGGGGLSSFPPTKNKLGMGERGGISNGEGKWVPVRKKVLTYRGTYSLLLP
jgi:hypothetical protein